MVGTNNAVNNNLLSGANPVNVGTDATAKTVTVGNTTGASALALKSGTGHVVVTSATGTLMTINDTGAVTKPLQPSFLAYLTNNLANVTGAGATYSLNATAFTKIFDQNTNFDATTGIFTAPVAGVYLFICSIRAYNVTAAMTQGSIGLVTTARTYLGDNLNWGACKAADNGVGFTYSVFAPMNATDTAYMTLILSNGAGNTAGINGTALLATHFSGALIC